MTETPDQPSTPEARRDRWLTSQAMRLFVEILGETASCQPMLLELREDVVSRYREAYERSGLPDWRKGDWRDPLWVSRGPGRLQHELMYYLSGEFERDSATPPEQEPRGRWELFIMSTLDQVAIRAAAGAFREWADCHGVVDDWLIRLLSQVCVSWATDPAAADSLATKPPTRPLTPDDLLGDDKDQPPDLGYYLIRLCQSSRWRRWAPEAESWESYRAKAVAAFTHFLDHEYKPTVEPMPAGSKLPHALPEHLSWTARHYFGRETVEGISESVGREPKTVRDGIRAARDRLALSIPPRGK